MDYVTINFLGPLRRPADMEATTRYKLPMPLTLSDLLVKLGFDANEQKHLRVLLQGQPLSLKAKLEGGEKLTIFMPLGGG